MDQWRARDHGQFLRWGLVRGVLHGTPPSPKK
jgi:hypothetical protein